MPPKLITETCTTQDRPPLTVALAYEGDAALRAAKDLYLGVVRPLTDHFTFRDFWCRFDMLAEQKLFACAVGIAAEADIVFCCPRNPHVLPRAVQDWLCHWLTRRTQPDGALVVLLPFVAGTTPSPTLVERDLRETARVSGLTFFVNYYLSPHAPHSLTNALELPRPVGKDMDTVRVVHHGAGEDHWELNKKRVAQA